MNEEWVEVINGSDDGVENVFSNEDIKQKIKNIKILIINN